MNTAKYVVNHKSRALELASERKKSADLEAKQRTMAQRIRELEERVAGNPPTPVPVNQEPHCRSVRISRQVLNSTGTTMDSEDGEIVCLDDDGTEEAEFNKNGGNPKTSTPNSAFAPTTPRNLSRTSHAAIGADSGQFLDGID
jgi:hypothetical protein